MPVTRKASISRRTKETSIRVEVDLDGTGAADIRTGIGFFDHMLEQIARHGRIDLCVQADGDLHVDGHHTVEDCGIVLGNAIAKAVGDKKGINRYGYFVLPMDEALIVCAVDLCGRPYYSSDVVFQCEKMGDMDTQLVKEFFYSVSYAAGMNLHFKMLAGANDHHICEAMFKAFGKALDMAVSYEPRCKDVPSTKGALE